MNDDEFVEKVAENNRIEMRRYEDFCQKINWTIFLPKEIL
ncbi:putative aminotransferase [Haemophilus influenzae 22.1-21]|nr:putative aminotransferase [Haemophilus influenzae 22.1-21]